MSSENNKQFDVPNGRGIGEERHDILCQVKEGVRPTSLEFH